MHSVLPAQVGVIEIRSLLGGLNNDSTINDSLQVNGELHVTRNGLFDFGATGSVNVGTPQGNPEIIGLAPNGGRRDIQFSNDGILLTVSGAQPVPPDVTIYADRVAIRTNVGMGQRVGCQSPSDIDAQTSPELCGTYAWRQRRNKQYPPDP